MAKNTTKKAFKVTLQLGDKSYTSEADDLKTALLSLKPEKISAKAIFTAEHNGKKVEMQRVVGMTKRIVSNDMTALVFAKNLMMRLS